MRKRKKGNTGKGSAWERAVCKRLSEWWTQDEDPPRPDVFWRTSQSGGRSTTKAKKGECTRFHHGDVCAVDPIGQPLLDLLTIEIKKGYNTATIQDLLDKPLKSVYKDWFEKAENTAFAAKTPYWMLIHQRDRREPLCFVPNPLFFSLGIGGPLGRSLTVDCLDMAADEILSTRLEDFLDAVDPDDVKLAVKERK